MIYPKFIEKNDTIGICAPSAGVGHKLDLLKESNKVLRSLGYKVKETKSVRKDNPRGGTARQRAKELDELILDPKVKLVLAAAGGDYMLEMMEYVNFEHIKDNPKWMSGMSDPTNLLFTVTTNLDIATFYGKNGSGFCFDGGRTQRTFFNYIKGNVVSQKSYPDYQEFIETINEITVYNHKVKWISKEPVTISGRLIGGCIEVIDKLIGTKFDKTNEFIDRYKDDGIVWYFDVFNMSSYDFYLNLLQFKNAGWFRYCKGVLIGRVAFPRIEDKKLDYIKAADKVLKDIPHICEMDLGHTDPGMTLINGALVTVDYKDNKGKISFKLK